MVPPPPRRWLSALIAVGLLTATGCSPAPEPTAGLQRDGSGYAVVVPLCPEGTMLSVSVYDVTPGATARWSVSSDEAHGAVDRFPLFATPPGWTAEYDELTALTAGTTYGVSAAGRANTRDLYFHFTLADLEKLRDGEVLTYKKGGGTARVKAGAFRTRALKLC